MNFHKSFCLACIVGLGLHVGVRMTNASEFLVGEAILEVNPIPFGPLPRARELHASSITEARDGALVATWFGGKEENDPSVRIWVSRKQVDGVWGQPVVVDAGVDTREGKTREYSTWNPVLFTDPATGTIYLWYKITGLGPQPGYRNWWGAVRTSDDNGETWSERIWLPEVPRDIAVFGPYNYRATGPVKNRPLVLPDGRLLCGSSTETGEGWRTHFEIYQAGDWTGQEHGVEIVGPIDGRGIQASMVTLSADRQWLGAFTRDDGYTTSKDGGATWSPIEKSPVTTSKGFHAVTTANGVHFLVFNPDESRTPLSLARSLDGENWETLIVDLQSNEDWSMDYPTIMQAADGALHVTHTFGRRYINHLVLDTDYLEGQGTLRDEEVPEGAAPEAAPIESTEEASPSEN